MTASSASMLQHGERARRIGPTAMTPWSTLTRCLWTRELVHLDLNTPTSELPCPFSRQLLISKRYRYRMQSRKILSVIKESLPSKLQRVEKASIDEVVSRALLAVHCPERMLTYVCIHVFQFLDLSAQVHATLLERFPELRNPPPHDDPGEKLPMPSTTALDWQADALVDLDDTETETDDPDWDDVAILIGSEIVRDVRAAIRAQVRYTCSAVCQSHYHSHQH